MKNFFSQKSGAFQPSVDNTTNPPAAKSTMKVEDQASEKVIEQAPEAAEQTVWKSFRANSCGDATQFLNENKIDPQFMIMGSNSQIFIFYKG